MLSQVESNYMVGKEMKKKIGRAFIMLGIILIMVVVFVYCNIDYPKESRKQQQDSQDPKHTEEFLETSGERKTKEEEQTETVEEPEQDAEEATESTEENLTAHAINPEVYEWPCENPHFEGRPEPIRVREFARNKKYFDAVAEQFAPYEGKDISYYIAEGMLQNEQSQLNGGSVEAEIDVQKIADLLKHTSVEAVAADGESVEISIKGDKLYRFLYFYDADASEETNEFISEWWMVNISSHWWCWYLGDGT